LIGLGLGGVFMLLLVVSFLCVSDPSQQVRVQLCKCDHAVKADKLVLVLIDIDMLLRQELAELCCHIRHTCVCVYTATTQHTCTQRHPSPSVKSTNMSKKTDRTPACADTPQPTLRDTHTQAVHVTSQWNTRQTLTCGCSSPAAVHTLAQPQSCTAELLSGNTLHRMMQVCAPARLASHYPSVPLGERNTTATTATS
jgi:hypothetical protein